MTEFALKGQPNVSLPTAGPEKKKGGQKRRTKREDPNAVPTAPGHSANTTIPNGTRTGIVPPPEDPQWGPQKRRPCLVRSTIYNPDYPTFCECMQPYCPHHCPAARGIISRGCTTYSWPAHEAMSYGDRSPPTEPRTNHDAGVETRHPGGLVEEPRIRKCDPFPVQTC